MKTNLLLLSIAGFLLLSIPVFGADKVVVIPMGTNKASGSDGQVQYNDGGKLAGASIYYNKNDASLGIGTTNPQRTLHVKGGWPGQFESSSTRDSAILDLNQPNISTGHFSRLDWRSDNSDGDTTQFAAIDVFYDDKDSGSETASMRFQTLSHGTWKEAMRIKWGQVGIGTDNPAFKLDVQKGSQYSTSARIFNSYDGGNTTVLRLQVGRETPTASNNFIEFRAGAGAGSPIAAIEGDGSGGVTYKTSGSDFAEYLPLSSNSDNIEAGDVVGLTGGFISKEIMPESQVRVISSAPGVLGNFPGEKQEHLFRKVAFLGQVPVKVRGPVHRGDFILPSGKNDGTGIAVSPEALTPDRYGQIVGVAWQSSNDNTLHMVNTEVGLHSAIRLLGEQSLRKEQQLKQLLMTVQTMQARLQRLEGRVVEMNTLLRQNNLNPYLVVSDKLNNWHTDEN